MGGMTGHWENLCRRISDEFEKRGIQTIIFGQEKFKDNIISGLNFEGVFTRSPYVEMKKEKDFLKECKIFDDDFNKIDKGRFNGNDILIIPTVFPQTLLPFINWSKDIVDKKGAHAAIIFQFPGGEEKNNSKIKKPRLLRRLKKFIKALFIDEICRRDTLKSISWQESKQISYYFDIYKSVSETKTKNYRYFASSDELAENFSKIFKLKITPLPMPAPVNKFNVDYQITNNDSKITIGYFGHASLAKGAQFLMSIVKKTIPMHENTEFLLHINPNPDTENILEPFKNKLNRVECVHGHINQEKLMEMIDATDIVLMPYDPIIYTTTPSAVFTECMMKGKVFVTPNHTWIARQSKQFGAGVVLFDSFDFDAIYGALDKAIINYKELKKLSIKAREFFVKTHNIENFINIILR